MDCSCSGTWLSVLYVHTPDVMFSYTASGETEVATDRPGRRVRGDESRKQTKQTCLPRRRFHEQQQMHSCSCILRNKKICGICRLSCCHHFFFIIFFFYYSLPLNLSSVLQNGFVQLENASLYTQQQQQCYALHFCFGPPSVTVLILHQRKLSLYMYCTFMYFLHLGG